MGNRNVLYMEEWVKDKEVIENIMTTSKALAGMSATTDFLAGKLNNDYPKHSQESYAYMKRYNELVRKNEH